MGQLEYFSKVHVLVLIHSTVQHVVMFLEWSLKNLHYKYWWWRVLDEIKYSVLMYFIQPYYCTCPHIYTYKYKQHIYTVYIHTYIHIFKYKSIYSI